MAPAVPPQTDAVPQYIEDARYGTEGSQHMSFLSELMINFLNGAVIYMIAVSVLLLMLYGTHLYRQFMASEEFYHCYCPRGSHRNDQCCRKPLTVVLECTCTYADARERWNTSDCVIHSRVRICRFCESGEGERAELLEQIREAELEKQTLLIKNEIDGTMYGTMDS